MKDEPRKTTSGPATAPAKHQFDHEVPTVIHHPEEDMTILARWLQHGMEQGATFWVLIAGVVFVVVVLGVVAGGISQGESAAGKGWTELIQAKTPGEMVEVAEAYPNTPVERWATYQAAVQFYDQGFTNLPENRDAALPQLQNALKRFEEVAQEAPKTDPVARSAALGAARTLEAMNDLDKAKEAYRKVAADFPDTPEARRAELLAKRLDQPEAVEFYKKLYAYTRPEPGKLPPAPTGLPGLPGLPGFGGSDGSSLSSPLGSGGLNLPSPLGSPPSADPVAPPPTNLPALELPSNPLEEVPPAKPSTPPPSPANEVLPPGASPK